jgi:hypothetical protein
VQSIVADAFQPAISARFLAAFGEPASQPATPPASQPAPPVERAHQNPETPVATASLAPPAPPIRRSETTPPRATGAKGDVKVGAAAPTECLPNGLRAVLADVAAQFGPVTIVSTHQLNTANHSPGSIREKLHHACNAVDFRPDRERVDEVKKYLRGRPEIGGVESYRNGVVHMDLKGSEVAGASPQAAARRQATAQATTETAQPPAAAPAPEPPGLFRLFGR